MPVVIRDLKKKVVLDYDQSTEFVQNLSCVLKLRNSEMWIILLCYVLGFIRTWIFNYFFYRIPWLDRIKTMYTCFPNFILLQDPIGGVKSLNRYLDTGCSDELCEEIASACSFDNMKQHKENTAQPELQAMFKDKKIPFYRKGRLY